MSIVETKAVATRYLEEFWNSGKMETADDIIAPDYTDHRPVGEAKGPAALKQFATAFRSTFPDLHFTLEDQLAEREKAVVRWTFTGTHKGELLGIAATGKQVTLQGATILHFSAGKITETWVFWDRMSLMEQLGVSSRAT
jgi:steroid delta-isomerase-like uncharacterized protein